MRSAKRVLLLTCGLLLLLVPEIAVSEYLDHAWSQSFGDSQRQGAYSVATDAFGNVLVTGDFYGTVDFGGGPITALGLDFFVAKFDGDGSHVWSRGWGVSGAATQSLNVVADASGNVIVTGGFTSTIDLGGGPLTNSGWHDIFLAKFDAFGNHIWSQRFGDWADSFSGGVTVDGSGNLILTGGFDGSVDFGGGPLISAGARDAFVAKFDALGNHIWSQRFGDPIYWEIGTAVAADASGNSVVIGFFPDTLFIRKLDADGNLIWGWPLDGEGSTTWRSVGIDVSGNVIVTGNFLGTLDFGGGALTSAGASDIFVVKFDADGGHIWSQSFGDSEHQYSRSLAVDVSGKVIITGEMRGTVDFGGGPLTSVGNYDDLFIAKFDAAGNHVWSQAYGDTNTQIGNGIAADASTNVIVTGYFLGSVDFGGGPLTAEGTSYPDVFVAKFRPCDPILHVDADATGTGTGASWADAVTEVQDALSLVGAPCLVTEIWVAEGTYKPTGGTDRSATFQLQNGVTVYGGFAGTETMLAERDWMANPTTLSGDIGVVADNTDNSYHVVTGSGTDATAVLDGFTVTGGRGDGIGNDATGGGMYNNAGSPTLTNVSFLGNSASDHGGGMHNHHASSPTLRDVTFSGNTASVFGGGMHNRNESSPTLINVVFSGNSVSDHGGGMANRYFSSPTLINVAFSGNSASDNGGGMYNYFDCNPALLNVTFSGNSAGAQGGGMYNLDNSSPTLINTVYWGDSGGLGDEIYNLLSSAPNISYSLIEGSGGSGGGWDPSLGADGGNNIDADPLFISAPADLRLGAGSPAIDAGDNTAQNLPATDLDGNPRIVGVAVDMGAYENQGTASGIDDDREETIPSVTALRSAYPNPFNPVVTLGVDLDHDQDVRLSVYDVQGKLVRTLLNEFRTAGTHEVRWDGRDATGNAVSSGVYFFRLEAGSEVLTKKGTLLK